MANITTYTGGEVIKNRNGLNAAGFPVTGVLYAEYDASLGGAAISDTVDIADLPAGTVVNGCVLEVVTTDGCTIAVGSSDSDAFVAATACGSAGKTLGAGADLGTIIATDQTLRLTVTVAAADTVKVKVYADVTIYD